LLCIATIIIYGLSRTIVSAENLKVEHRKILKESFLGNSKGVITSIHYYKGHSLEVKYKINHKTYEYSGGWDHNPKGLGVGDSIQFKYAIKKPDVIVTELDDDYEDY